MCAVLHKYRPPIGDEGGGPDRQTFFTLEMGPTGDSWETWCPSEISLNNPQAREPDVYRDSSNRLLDGLDS